MKYLLVDTVNSLKTDLLYCQLLPAAEVIAACSNPAPKVIDVFDIWSGYANYTPNPILRFVVTRILEARERRAFQAMDKIVACTKQTRQAIIQRFDVPSENTMVIHDGVDSSIFYPTPPNQQLRDELGLKPKDFVLIFHGGIKPHDGLTILVKAVAHLNKEIPVKAMIIGGGSHLRILKKEARKRDVEDSIIFLGKRPHEEIPKYLSIARAGVLTRLTWQGDIAASMMECMASGLPFICADLKGMETHFTDRHDVLLFKTGDSESLANSIRNLHGDQELYDHLKQNARPSISRFDRHQSADKLLALVDNMIGDRVS